MRCAVLLAAALAAVASAGAVPTLGALRQQQLLREIAAAKPLWAASADSWVAQLAAEGGAERLLGHQGVEEEVPGVPFVESVQPAAFALPENFDARKTWPKCPTIGQIRDQSKCGSCWAFGAVEAMSDRECVLANRSVVYSAEHMLACSGAGDCPKGGYAAKAWAWWVKDGCVTESCLPYSFPSCDHHIPGSKNPCPNTTYPTPSCKKECAKDYKTTFAKDIRKGKQSHGFKGETNMMNELTRGPIESCFLVYEDFYLYKTGIYHHVSGKSLGGHCIKVVGWGVEKGVKYWIAANSWNTNWGDNGFFRIRRGNDEANFETRGSVSGLPL